MGTRSLLGYETKPGTVYMQYMQFDGSPMVKGKEFYEGVIKNMGEGGRAFFINEKTGRPTNEFFSCIRNFLNNYQYQTGHSINNHATESIRHWNNASAISRRWNAEWQYLFKRNGDFIFNTPGGSRITIPWEFTKRIIEDVGRDIKFNLTGTRNNVFGPFWNYLSDGDMIEVGKVCGWGKDITLHVSDELDYDNAKILRSRLLKGENIDKILKDLKIAKNDILPGGIPDLSLEVAERDVGDNGWTRCCKLILNGKVLLKSPSYLLTRKRLRNKRTITVKIPKNWRC